MNEELKEKIEQWKPLGYKAKDVIAEYLKTLTRVELMNFQDEVENLGLPKEHSDFQEALWEACNDAEWDRDWPMGEHEYRERIPDIVRDTMPISYSRPKNKEGRLINLDLNELEKQVNGMQKKLDKIVKLLENFEIKMSVKDALEM